MLDPKDAPILLIGYRATGKSRIARIGKPLGLQIY